MWTVWATKLFKTVGVGVILLSATGDSNACSYIQLGVVSVFYDAETGETIEVHANGKAESGVVYRILENCEDYSESKLCPKSEERK